MSSSIAIPAGPSSAKMVYAHRNDSRNPRQSSEASASSPSSYSSTPSTPSTPEPGSKAAQKRKTSHRRRESLLSKFPAAPSYHAVDAPQPSDTGGCDVDSPQKHRSANTTVSGPEFAKQECTTINIGDDGQPRLVSLHFLTPHWIYPVAGLTSRADLLPLLQPRLPLEP